MFKSVRDQKPKIIRNVVPQGAHGDKVNIVYDHIHYVDLCKSQFTVIRVQLLDSQGNHIKFSKLLSKLTVKLHFKLKNESI